MLTLRQETKFNITEYTCTI